MSKLPVAAAAFDFQKDIQPLLENACVRCHGAEKQKGGFRIDTRAGLMKGGEDGKAIVEGQSAASPLIHYIARLVEDLEMPPKKEDALKPEQIGVLRAWIDDGAKWPAELTLASPKRAGDGPDKREYWAFKPPVRAALPAVKNAAWAREPIDSFVLAKLDSENLTPSAEADKTTLLRRLSLDLVGLPPTISEVDEFLADASPDAYRKQVERLLASPHYGERWARDWLDAARYADSDGYEKDKPRVAHFYRDWVIDAFNRDLPYSEFVIEQLAGDQLPNATQEQIVATGFLRNSMINEEGGADPEQFRMEAMFDRMEAVGKSVLGLTIQCAQCHDHKYDPISQHEYFRLFAFLNNDDESQPLVFTPEEQMRRADVLRQVGEIEAELAHENADRIAAWEDEWKQRAQPEWRVIQPIVEDISTGGQRYLPQADGSFIAAGYQPTKHEAKMTMKLPDAKGITAFRLEVMNDANLPAQGPGRSHLGTFGLTEFKAEASGADGRMQAVNFSKAVADLEPAPETPVRREFNEKEPKHRVIGPASYAIDGNEETAWSNDVGPGRRNHACVAIFTTEKPVANDGDGTLTIKLTQKHGGWNSDDLQGDNLGRFRIAVTTASDADRDLIAPTAREAMAVPREQRDASQKHAIFAAWLAAQPEQKDARAAIDALWKQYPEGTTQLVLSERTKLRETHMLKRGDWLKPARVVTPNVPAILNPLPANAQATRLTFARWLVDPKAPTTARVFVNRVWQHYFGTGIVATPEDFGTQSEAPSHPELLDWLACEFMGSGWSVKHLQRLIVNSATYRQSSRTTPEIIERDPYNRLLARGPRFRVEGEIVRDIQLAASGLLNPEIGGRSVMPPAPAFLFQPPASYAPFPWIEEKDGERYRRAIYTYRRRTTPYPMLQAFDTPEGNVSCIRRSRSNTPLQALMTLNETLAVEAARALARRTLEEGGSSDSARIEYGFRRCLSRAPSDAERTALLEVIAKQTARISAGGVRAEEVASGKNEPLAELPAGTTAAQFAAYTVVSRVLLNLDEMITKE